MMGADKKRKESKWETQARNPVTEAGQWLLPKKPLSQPARLGTHGGRVACPSHRL